MGSGMKKILAILAFLALFNVGGAARAQLFNTYGPKAGIQYNPGLTPQDSAATGAQVAATYAGLSGCSGSAALLFNATCSPVGTGTVTSVTCGTGLTGGTITTTGTCALSTPVSSTNGGTGEAGTFTGVRKANSAGADTAALAADTAATYTGGSGCSGAAALLFNATCALIPAATTFANPSAAMLLTVVNGSATTAMRSDAAFAFPQNLSPTMTGSWLFTGALSPSVATGVSIGVNTFPVMVLTNGTPAANSRKIIEQVDTSGSFLLQTLNDAASAADTILSAARSGTTVSAVTIGNATDLPAITLDGPVTIPAPASGSVLTMNSASGGGIASYLSCTSLTGTQNCSYWIGSAQSSGNSGGLIWNNNSGSPYLSLETFANGAPVRIGAGSSAVLLPSIASSTSAQTGTVCWTTGGNLTFDPSLGCLASSARFKDHIAPLDTGLKQVLALRAVHYQLRAAFNAAHLGEQVGLIAEEVQKVDPRLVGLDDKGQPLGVRYAQLTALLVQGEKDLEGQIWQLRAGLAALLLWNCWLTWGRRHGR